MFKRGWAITVAAVVVFLLASSIIGLFATVLSNRAQQVRACSGDIFPNAGVHNSVKKNICKCEYEYMEYFKLAGVFFGPIKYNRGYRSWTIEGVPIAEEYALCIPAQLPRYLR